VLVLFLFYFTRPADLAE